ncbi:type I-E CRISPR-associated protein Cas6/Cse3/CasE [Neisseriaceae bacterium TC5R-5]|nr:type I-E CRISPR-associated protein Cas6/Cse3/CasE [Neisseriaceae bacterium TC5R-5]
MPLITSLLQLDRHAVKALRLTDPYALHRIVYSLYPDVRSDADKQAGHSSGILYADQGGNFQQRRILLLANRSPADCVDGQYGTVNSRAVPDSLFQHHHYHFKVLINPSYRDNASRKIMPVCGEAATKQWFAQRAEQSWGFIVHPEYLQVDQQHVLRFDDKAGRPITLAQASVSGVLRVSHAERFRHSFTHGLGRGRAFGCGLLQIVPLPTPSLH